jgi:hypothetical protein
MTLGRLGTTWVDLGRLGRVQQYEQVTKGEQVNTTTIGSILEWNRLHKARRAHISRWMPQSAKDTREHTARSFTIMPNSGLGTMEQLALPERDEEWNRTYRRQACESCKGWIVQAYWVVWHEVFWLGFLVHM